MVAGPLHGGPAIRGRGGALGSTPGLAWGPLLKLMRFVLCSARMGGSVREWVHGRLGLFVCFLIGRDLL